MASILAVDGPVYRSLSRATELIMLSVIWWLLSIPVITAPAATSWLVHGVRETRCGARIPRLGESIGHLRSRFGISLRLAGLQLGVVGLVVIALFGPSPGGWYGQLVFAVGLIAAITVLLVGPWSVALLDQHRTSRDAVRAAYRAAISHLSLAFLSGVSVVGGAVAVLMAPSWVRLIAVVAVPGLAAALVTRLCDLATKPQERSSLAPSPDDHRLGEAIS